MVFGFQHQRHVTTQIRAIAREQIVKAIEESQADEHDSAVLVHSLRRRCKRLRGLLRLIEPGFEGYERENRAFRDAAAQLSGTRDAQVMAETFAALAEAERRRGDRMRLGNALIDAVQARLQARAEAGRNAHPAAIAAFRQTMQAAARRVRDWSLDGKGRAVVAAGIEQTYRAMRQSMWDARGNPTAELLHTWRKHTKYHWHHVSLWERCAPDLLGGNKALLDRLGEFLGDHHNLAVLDETLKAEPGPLASSELVTLSSVIAERQAELAAAAFALGAQLTVEKPAALRRRFERYWRLLPRES